MRGRTAIAIAHRLSTLRDANRLVVLDRGSVVEIGNLRRVVALEGHYYRLYQALEDLAEDDAPPVSPDLAVDDDEGDNTMSTGMTTLIQPAWIHPAARAQLVAVVQRRRHQPEIVGTGVQEADQSPRRKTSPTRSIRTAANCNRINRLDDLPEATRELVRARLASREFMPVIQRIRSVSSFATPTTWANLPPITATQFVSIKARKTSPPGRLSAAHRRQPRHPIP